MINQILVTTYTTIGRLPSDQTAKYLGYGNITAKSRLGKLAAMIYAVIGIPLVLMILHKLGRFFLLCLQHLWNFLVWYEDRENKNDKNETLG